MKKRICGDAAIVSSIRIFVGKVNAVQEQCSKARCPDSVSGCTVLSAQHSVTEQEEKNRNHKKMNKEKGKGKAKPVLNPKRPLIDQRQQ